METMNRRLEEFDSLTDPKLLALLQAETYAGRELTGEDIRQEWRRKIGDVQYSVFGIVVNNGRIQYFGSKSKTNEFEEKISSYNGEGLAQEILKTLKGIDAQNPKLSIDDVNNELVITLPEEPAIRIPEKGEPYSS